MKKMMSWGLAIAIFLIPTASLSAQQPDIVAASQEAIDYIIANPDSVAFACYEGDNAPVLHQADQAFPLASSFKIFVLAEMGRQIDLGLISPDDVVALDAVNAYYLPTTDAGAHDQFLATFTSTTTEVTLGDLADGMIQHSSNAATDYLLDVLGAEGFATLFADLGVQNATVPNFSILGLYLASQNQDEGRVAVETYADGGFIEAADALENRFLSDPAWHDAEIAALTEQSDALIAAIQTGDFSELESFYNHQVAFFSQLGYEGSANDVLAVLDAIYTSDYFSEDSAAFMQRRLNWLLAVNPANQGIYDQLGNKGGSWASIFTGNWYVQPRESDPILLAVYYHDLPLELWSGWSATGINQMLELRAISLGEGCAVFADILAEIN